MGNQLVGIAPSQIYPVEHYLTDRSELQCDINLGSTRFFKVARARSQEGLVVVKVFVIHDPTLPLSAHSIQIERIRSKLASAVNCLPFRRAILSDKAALLMREFVKCSLYDRISTRPFLSVIEKKWIAFQILYALHQCHTVGVCHGDVKLENIMVTSWHWVLLTDFASYKPTYLPDDNPSDFSFFFDTSRRRTCYVAPERFLVNLNNESSIPNLILLQDADSHKDELKSSMDIFSAGCVLAELFSDGHPPFQLSQLLAYRNGEYNLSGYFEEKITDSDIRALIEHMIQLDPKKRLSAELYLDREKGKIFPEYFYSFLQSYMLMFSTSSPILSADEKIDRIKKDIEGIISWSVRKEADGSNFNRTTLDADALILIASLVTSCVRGLRLSVSKIQALDILYQLSLHTAVETVLDKIIPYMIHLLGDKCSRVRVRAVHSITKCLSSIHSVPATDANIFPEYLLPALAPMARDPAVVVRCAYATDIADISETGVRFLEYSQTVTLENNEMPCHNYESELSTLQEMILQSVSELLSDNCSTVKRTLIENGFVKLCIFFGRQRANDALLSHMTTFLNDKVDKQLRGSFFDCIPGVAGYIGVHCSPILKPLLQQGYSDPEEFVARKALISMTALSQLGLLHKAALYELLKDTACFLIHPNLWIKQAVVGFVTSLAKTFTMVEAQCKILPVILPYMKQPLIQLENETLLLNMLRAPLPRIVYDSAIRYSDLELFVETLRERQLARNNVNNNHVPSTSCIRATQNSSFNNFFRRLSSEGMTETVEDKLLSMVHHLRKLNAYYTLNEIAQKSMPPSLNKMGKIDVSRMQHKVKYRNVNLSRISQHPNEPSMVKSPRRRRGNDESQVLNEEWKHMFGSSNNQNQAQPSVRSGQVNRDSKKKQDISPTEEEIFGSESLQDQSYIQYRYPPCRLELEKLIKTKEQQYELSTKARDWIENETWLPSLPPPGWKLKSTLVAHLYEHKASVNRVVNIPESGFFASCSSDGCIRLWDCNKMEGRNIANRSRQMYNARSGRLNSINICRNKQSLAAVSEGGSVIVLNIDNGSSKMTALNKRELDLDDEGCGVDIAYFDPGSEAVLVYATMYGCIIGWDMRAYGNAWKISNKYKQGVVTTMCMDSFQNCVILGTGCGYHTCIDLRFRLPIASVVHPHGARIRRIIRHPRETSWIISAVQGNNEVSVWNMEGGHQQISFWASDTPPLSKPIVNKHGACALYAYNSDRSATLLTGGTDQRIRKWDLKPNSGDCQIAIPSAIDASSKSVSYTYQDRSIDGTRVIHELSHTAVKKETAGDGGGKSSSFASESFPLDQPAPGHRDTVTDITMCQTSQCFLVTSSQDGIIKVWK